ncbi:DUF1499 domain-containing protein [Jannaschia sp. Os4]|uniref:DUF1499 domain-containing protein n=1 Tax=Jannaschia sp. Os4 TaxID=2807617 RepID=UPI0019396783|nr:DUF1499 domain-containing protein [Jannaschia sp. Os4]MBM2577635.1 DUF1499 domain-containing protein [Jannaschia sp. Os4]
MSRTTRILATAGIAALAIGAAGAIYVRTAAMPADDWHADPEIAQRTGKPNDFLVAPGGDAAPVRFDEGVQALMLRLDAMAAARGAVRIAGTPQEGWATYVERTPLVGYPDAISVKAVPDGNGARLMLWSRSRFGHSDLGANEARVDDWLAALGA